MSGEGGDPPPAEGLGADQERAGQDDEQERATSAARTALQRARAAAAARGLRPGQRGRTGRPVRRQEPSRAGQDDRDPQAIGTGLERLVADRGWQVDVAVGGVMGRWARVVGLDVAAHCTPVTYEEGVLVVRADSSAWATQVRLLVPTLLRRLAEELGDGVVVQVQVEGPAAPSWRKGKRRVHGRGPRDTYG